MKRIIITILLSVIFFSIKSQNINGRILADSANITVVQVWGSHYERGFAQGYLLSDKILDIYNNYLLPQFGSYMATAKLLIQQGQHIRIDSVYIYEAMGIIDGMDSAGISVPGVDFLNILVANSFLDLQGFTGFKNLGLSNGCSSLMSWGDATVGTSLNGKAVISRHLDWSNVSPIVNNQVIVAHIPSEADEQNWVMIGHAGQIGSISGINTSGLTVFQHNLSDFAGNSAVLNQGYEPIWLSLRNAMEKADFNNDGAHNCNDVYDALSVNTKGYADGFIVTSLSASNSGIDSLVAMVAELTPITPLHTFRHNDYNDSIPGDNLYAANYEIKRNDHLHWCSRYLGVANNIGNGTMINDIQNWDLMRLYSNASSSNIQFMQFVPEDRYFNLSVFMNGHGAFQNDSIRYYIDDLFELPLEISSKKNKSQKLKIYPNPFDNSTSIKFDNPKKESFELSIISLKGDVVRSVKNINKDSLIISRDSLENGVYIIKLKGNKGTTYEDKIVIE